MASKYPHTIESMAAELGMTKGSFRLWKLKSEQKNKLKRPVVGSPLCEKEGQHLAYSDAYFDQIKKLRAGTKVTKPSNAMKLKSKPARKTKSATYPPSEEQMVMVYLPTSDLSELSKIARAMGWRVRGI